MSLRNELAYLRSRASIQAFNTCKVYRHWLLAEQLTYATSQKQSADDLANAYGNAVNAMSIGEGLEKRRTAGEAIAVKALSKREAEREKIAAGQFDVARNALAAAAAKCCKKR